MANEPVGRPVAVVEKKRFAGSARKLANAASQAARSPIVAALAGISRLGVWAVASGSGSVASALSRRPEPGLSSSQRAHSSVSGKSSDSSTR
jgi:hypothetical protein